VRTFAGSSSGGSWYWSKPIHSLLARFRSVAGTVDGMRSCPLSPIL
jgi:hypothetical protein